MRRSATTAALFAAILISFAACKSRHEQSGSPPGPHGLDKTPADFTLTADDLTRELETDPAALAKYTGKVLDVAGVDMGNTLVDKPGGGKAASDITLGSYRAAPRLRFVLDREIMDQRFLILDYWSLERWKGRFAGRDAEGTLRFTDAVLVTTDVSPLDYPTRASADAPTLLHAFWPPENYDTEGIKYQGRVIEMTGTIAELDPEKGLVLSTGDAEKPIWCHLRGSTEEFQKTHPIGTTVKLKAFCAGHMAGTTGVTLMACTPI
jgi:hypothetical protein